MKSGTTDKLKFKQLMRRLHLNVWQARGLLDTLWEFARVNAPRGDVGRFCNEEIAIGIDWQDDHDKLIEALVETKWLDRLESDARLYVHGWHEHAENSVHKKLVRAVEVFANGCLPNLSSFSISERSEILDKYVKKFPGAHFCENKPGDVETGAQKNEMGTRRGPQPEPIPEPEPIPAPLPLPIPEPKPEPARKPSATPNPEMAGSGVLREEISEEMLRDTGKLFAWLIAESLKPNPIIRDSENNREFVLAIAERALNVGKKNKCGLFFSLIRDNKREYATGEWQDRAKARHDEYRRQARGRPVNGVPTATLRRAT